MTRDEQARRLLQRAEGLEASLSRSLLNLDADQIARFAEVVLELGLIDNERLARIFEAATGGPLARAFRTFAEDSASMAGLPAATGFVEQEIGGATDYLVRHLTRQARVVLEETVQLAVKQGWSVRRLASAIERDIGLTEQQIGWIKNFERKLRTDPAKALQNQLRDRRSDRVLRRGDLSETEIERQVARYRAKWTRYRAGTVARVELLRASNSSNYAVWSEADARGDVPRMIRKFWHHAHDAFVRDSHIQIPLIQPNGVLIREAFVTPLGRLRYPLDPMGVPEDVIGCRCVVVFDTSTPGVGL